MLAKIFGILIWTPLPKPVMSFFSETVSIPAHNINKDEKFICHEHGPTKKSESSTGLEPMTSHIPARHTNQMSYRGSWLTRPFTCTRFICDMCLASISHDESVIISLPLTFIDLHVSFVVYFNSQSFASQFPSLEILDLSHNLIKSVEEMVIIQKVYSVICICLFCIGYYVN